jgi:hypothetical protein
MQEENAMKLYTMMPLMTDRIDEICDNIADQYERKIANEALFIMNLQPEGEPVSDKAANYCKTYDIYAERLAARGLRCGILAQATIGHGPTMTQKPKMQHIIGLTDGKESFTVCPYDENFRNYIEKAMATLTKRHPSTLMVDDDFRLFARNQRGCVCPRHLAEIGKRAGRSFTREELLSAMNGNGEEAQRIIDIFYDTQIDSLVGAAKAMRRGIDSVDPKQQGAFCLCGDTCEGVREIAKILAGEGNPVIIRVNNAKYTAAGARGVAQVISRAATQIAALDGVADYFLAETDTCPHNRYSTSASSLHTHFTTSILEGVAGCKHWITKTNNFEPQSGKAYRDKLAKFAGFYNTLSEITPTIKWKGCKIPLAKDPLRPRAPISDFKTPSNDIAWASCVLERLGIPMYFSKGNNGVIFFDGYRDEFFNDGEIKEMLSSTLVLSSISAQKLIERGFGEYLGIEISDILPNDPPARFEKYENGEKSTAQKKLKKITVKNSNVEVISEVYTILNGITPSPIFPAVTCFKNSLGGTAIVFAGSPDTSFTYSEAFSFLCSSRKKQLVSIMQKYGELPVYYPDDAEVYMKAGILPDGGIFCAFFNIGLDNLEEVTLVADRKITEITMLSPDGKFNAADFSVSEDGKITVNTPADILNPVILCLR